MVSKLKEVIGNRPVGFIGHGHSLARFKEQIERFRDRDICWVSLNQVLIAKNVLNIIGKELDIILGYASGYEDAFKDEKCYVHRYSEGRGNSLSEFLHQCIDIGVPLIFCVGCDGWSDGDEAYYGCGIAPQRVLRHMEDTQNFNATFPDDTKETKIFNLSENSKYKLKKISIDELLANFPRKNKDISLLLPTRDRILLLGNLLLSLQLKTSCLDSVEVLVALDDDDYFTKVLLREISRQSGIDIRAFIVPRRKNLHSYYNYLYKHSVGRYVICLNDDSYFETHGWDRIVVDKMDAYLADKPDGVAYGWIEDKLKNKPGRGMFCCFPVVSRPLHDRLGYIQSERFNCGGADIMLHRIYDGIGRICRIDKVVINHLTPHNGSRLPDKTNIRIKQMEKEAEAEVHTRFGSKSLDPSDEEIKIAETLIGKI